jgi:dTDP-4-amino-4,6-dideoxy-D-glucose acyltransferase
MAFLTEHQIAQLGFASVGRHVQISERAVFYNCANIEIGHHTRIDDFCVISAGEGGIQIGNYVHIAVFCALMGNARIHMADYSGLSSRVSVYSSNDDYSGASMTNPTVPIPLRKVKQAPVTLEKHVIVGSGSIILPGVTLGQGCAVGALSLVNRNCDALTTYAGAPAKRIGVRQPQMLALELQIKD